MASLADIQTIVDTILPGGTYATAADEPEFARLVRSSSVLLKQNNPITYDDIRLITPSAYHRVFLRIAAGRNADNTFLYSEADILEMMQPPPTGGTAGSQERFNLYGGDIQWCVAKLVAAQTLRTIPLNGSLKFKDVGDNLEVQALEDIDRIITLLNSATVETEPSVIRGEANLYIAHSLNLNDLPETGFDIPDPPASPPLTYNNPVAFTNVSTTGQILPPSGNEEYYCHVYMSGQSQAADQDLIWQRDTVPGKGRPHISSDVSFSIKLTIKIQPLWTIDDIITELADAMNSACLSSSASPLSNILVAPIRGPRESKSVTVIKGELYPNTAVNKTRAGVFNLNYRTNRLSFTTRRYSNKVNTEIFTVTFFTIDPGSSPESPDDFVGGERSLTSIKNAIRAEEGNGALFILGIPGLIYGENSNYSTLGDTVPAGFFLTVDKGDKPSVSIESATGSTGELRDSISGSGAENALDAFYFYAPDNTIWPLDPNPNLYELRFRVSSSQYSADPVTTPREVVVNLATIPSVTYVGEYIAEKVVDAFYAFAQTTYSDTDSLNDSSVLAVQLGDYERVETSVNRTDNSAVEIPLERNMDSFTTQFIGVEAVNKPTTGEDPWVKDYKAGRVQLVGFKYKEQEYKIVVDIVNIPPGLEVAIGNFELRRTTWSNRRRSIQVDLKTLSTNSAVAQQTTAEELASVNASVGKAEATKSPILQQVYDKLRLLNEAKKGFPTKWHSQT